MFDVKKKCHLSYEDLKLGPFHYFLGSSKRMRGFQGGSVIRNLPANAGDTGDTGSIAGLGRSPE